MIDLTKLGQPKPFKILREGAQQRVPALTAMPVGAEPLLGRNFMGLATAVHETTEGPALAITVQGPAGVAVTALLTPQVIGAAMAALNASAGRLADQLAPAGKVDA